MADGARPFIKWVGGKRQLITQLLDRIPATYDRYFEPMVGGGALFFALSPKVATIADINEELINAYRVIQHDVKSLISDLKHHRHDEEYFYEIRNKDRLSSYKRWSPVRRAGRLIYLNKTCYNGLYRVNSKGHFNTPFGDYKNPKIVDEKNLSLCHYALQGIQIELAPFASVLRLAGRNDFVYFDPPYAPLSATSNFLQYSKDGFTNEMQIELRDVCQKLDKKGVKFMLSNSSAPAILEMYSNFRIEFVDAKRHINSVASKRGYVKEIIVRNY